jgi:hypothetical protein
MCGVSLMEKESHSNRLLETCKAECDDPRPQSNASLGALAITGPFAFFALFAAENLADYRGG